MPFSASSRALPPVERISMLRRASERASSIRPVLSETESSARRTGSIGARAAASGAPKSELLQLLTQRATVDAEDARGAALVALRVVEHDAKQRLLDFAQHQVVQMSRTMPVQAGEVITERPLGVV